MPFSPITYDGTVLVVDSIQTVPEHGKMAFGLTTPRGLAIILPLVSYLVGVAAVYGVHRRYVEEWPYLWTRQLPCEPVTNGFKFVCGKSPYYAQYAGS